MATPDDSFYTMPVAFQFRVKVVGLAGKGEGEFSEVSGLSAKMSSSKVQEAGNSNPYTLPSVPVFEPLVLKRGLLKGSPLTTWVETCLKKQVVTLKTIVISLLDEEQKGLICWQVLNAYPTSIKVDPFNSTTNKVVIEALEFAYETCYRVSCLENWDKGIYSR